MKANESLMKPGSMNRLKNGKEKNGGLERKQADQEKEENFTRAETKGRQGGVENGKGKGKEEESAGQGGKDGADGGEEEGADGGGEEGADGEGGLDEKILGNLEQLLYEDFITSCAKVNSIKI